MSIFKSIKEITINSFTNTTDFIRGTGSTFIETVTDNLLTEKISEIKQKGTNNRINREAEKLAKKQAKLDKKLVKILQAQAELEANKLF